MGFIYYTFFTSKTWTIEFEFEFKIFNKKEPFIYLHLKFKNNLFYFNLFYNNKRIFIAHKINLTQYYKILLYSHMIK